MKIPVSYLRMSEPALRKLLSRKKLPHGHAEAVLTEVAEARNKRRIRLKTDEQHSRLWGDVIAPAKAERLIVRRMRTLKLDNPSPERDLALEAYLMVLDVIIGKLALEARDSGMTPGDLAAGRNLPNKGAHWVDWMPPKKIALIKGFFDAIPYTKGVRTKQPFERRIPQSQHAKHKQRLIERTAKEIEHLERRIAAELADTRLTDNHVFKQQEINALRQRVSKMQTAMHTIRLLRPTDYVPVTWHGIDLPD